LRSSAVGDFLHSFVAMTVAVCVIKAVLQTLGERAAKWPAMDPVEKNLQRVSHACVYMLVFAVIKFSSLWRVALGLYIDLFGHTERTESWLNGILIFGFVICCARLRTGWRSFRYFNPQFHPEITVLRVGAVVRIAGGIGSLIYLFPRGDTYIYAGEWWALFYVSAFVAAACFVVAGLIRLFMLRPRTIDVPEPGPDPRDQWTWE
jgi:hypothetical protein